MQTVVAKKEGSEASGLDSLLGESFHVPRLEQSVSVFDMQVAKTNAVPGRGCTICSIGEVQIQRSFQRPYLIIS